MNFSVVIPAYNREAELKVSIESVLNQTYQNFELIVVDNGSTDNTSKVVKEFKKRDQRIKYIWQENSGSPAGSRNTGIENARFNWIAFLDSDDYWYPSKLQEVFRGIESNPHVIAVSHFEEKIVNGRKKSILKHGMSVGKPLYESLLFSGNAFSVSAMTVRKDKLLEAGLFDIRRDYFAVEDYDMWMKLSKLGIFLILEKTLGVFCINDANMSGDIDFLNNNLKRLVLDHIEQYGSANIEYLKRKHGARIEYYRGRSYQLDGEWRKAVPILINSIKEFPWALRKYISLMFAFMHITR